MERSAARWLPQYLVQCRISGIRTTKAPEWMILDKTTLLQAMRLPDGSVIGAYQAGGSGPVRSVSLPPGTLKVKEEMVCASLRGFSFEPCFNLSRTGEQSFRGSLAGLDRIAHCDFARH